MANKSSFHGMAWWLASLFLLLSRTAGWFDPSAVVVIPPTEPVLAVEPLWQVPVFSLPGAEALTRWPFFIFAGVASVLFSWLARRIADNQASWLAIAFLIGSSLSLSPHSLATAVFAWIACRLVAKSLRLRTRCLLSVAIFALSVATTLDFGFVLIPLIAGLINFSTQPTTPSSSSDIVDSRSVTMLERLMPAAVAVALIGGAAASNAAFAAALLRPLNWLWAETALLSAVRIQFGMDAQSVGQLLLVTVIIAAVWRVMIFGNSGTVERCVAIVLAACGLGCGYFTAPAAIALTSLNAVWPAGQTAAGQTISRPSVSTPSVSFKERVLSAVLSPWSCLLLVLVYWSWLFSSEGSAVVGGSGQPERIDPLVWPFEGSVLLTDRDHSKDWNHPEIRRRFPVLVNDRWDAKFQDFREYYLGVMDLKHGRREHYMRSDLSFGGFRDFLSRYQSVAIVVDSSDLDLIRHLSVDPLWRVMSVDSRRTTFGLSNSSRTAAQTRRASRLFLQLEWPRAGVQMPLEGTLALGLPRDSRVVAQVLASMRLPFAALRVLPADDSASTRAAKTWCYLELAHRALRHTGQPSLLDQWRATTGLKQIEQRLTTGQQDTERIARALNSLSNSEVRSIKIDADPPETNEQNLRFAIAQGDRDRAAFYLAKLSSGPLGLFYGAVVDSSQTAPENVRQQLTEALESSQLPSRLRPEILFYRGTLALEIGDVAAARFNFEECRKFGPESRFFGLCDQYAKQLTSR